MFLPRKGNNTYLYVYYICFSGVLLRRLFRFFFKFPANWLCDGILASTPCKLPEKLLDGTQKNRKTKSESEKGREIKNYIQKQLFSILRLFD